MTCYVKQVKNVVIILLIAISVSFKGLRKKNDVLIKKKCSLWHGLDWPLHVRYFSFNQSPKGNVWSAIPVALLCMLVIVGDG